MINLNPFNKSIILIKKRIYFKSSDFSMPILTFVKYPIFLKALFNRINQIKTYYSINSEIRIFDLNQDKIKAQKDLQGKGGIYILWCHNNGLFYVGSAIRFFTNKGRLNDYFMKGRVKSSLAGKSSKVSKNLAESINKFSINKFTLIIPEEYNSDKLTKNFIQHREQLWMLLYPTLNSSFFVSSNDGKAMTEKNRIKLSTINKFYQYEVKDGVIISGSEKLIYGMKELSRTGLISSDKTIHPIEYNSVKGYLKSGLLWKNRFLLSYDKIQEGTILNNININNTRSTGVWVYEYKSRKFIAYEPSVKSCISKYGVSGTHLKRIRKFGLEFKNKLFSNQKLH